MDIRSVTSRKRNCSCLVLESIWDMVCWSAGFGPGRVVQRGRGAVAPWDWPLCAVVYGRGSGKGAWARRRAGRTRRGRRTRRRWSSDLDMLLPMDKFLHQVYIALTIANWCRILSTNYETWVKKRACQALSDFSHHRTGARAGLSFIHQVNVAGADRCWVSGCQSQLISLAEIVWLDGWAQGSIDLFSQSEDSQSEDIISPFHPRPPKVVRPPAGSGLESWCSPLKIYLNFRSFFFFLCHATTLTIPVFLLLWQWTNSSPTLCNFQFVQQTY